MIQSEIGSLNISAFKKVVFNNIKYHLQNVICLSFNDNNLPVFGKIVHLVIQDDKLYFFYNLSKTITNLNQFRAYSVFEQTDSAKYSIDCCDLRNKFPTYIYSVRSNRLNFTWQLIVLKFPIE